MLPSANAPVFDGGDPSFNGYKQHVRVLRQATNLDPSKKAAALISQMEIVARQVCLAAGSDVVMGGGGAERISAILRDYLGSDAADSAYQEVVRCLHSKRTDRGTDAYMVYSDLLRRRTESRMRVSGAPSPEAFVSVLRMQNAALSRSEKSPELPGVEGNLGRPAVAR